MGLKNFLKSLYITFTLVLIFLSSIPNTETWQPANGRISSVSSKSNQNTEALQVPQKRASGENLRRRMALSLDVSNDITEQKETDNYFESNNPGPYQTTNEGFSITADNYSSSNEINLNPQIIGTSNTKNISTNNTEGASPDTAIASVSNEEATIPLVDRMEGIFGFQNGKVEVDGGRKTMNDDGFNSVEEFYFRQDEAEEDQEPCRNNHDDHFKSSASKLYTKGPKLAYAYIAGLWLTAFMMRIINAVRKN